MVSRTRHGRPQLVLAYSLHGTNTRHVATHFFPLVKPLTLNVMFYLVSITLEIEYFWDINTP